MAPVAPTHRLSFSRLATPAATARVLTRARSVISAHDQPWMSSPEASAEVARSGSTSAALIVGELDGPEVGATVGVVETGGRVGVAVGELDGD